MKKRRKLFGALVMAALVIMALPVSEADAASADGDGEVLGSSSVVGNRAFIFWNTDELDVMEQTAPDSGPVSGAASLIGSIASNLGNLAAEGVVEQFPKYTVVDGKIVADAAFYQNDTLQEMTLPSGIEEIGQFSFARSSLKRISIPEGVVTVSYGAFYHCDNLTHVELSDSVVNVEPEAFAHTAWMENFKNGDADYLISGGVLVAYSGSDTEITVPGGVRVIAAGAFAGHEEIRTVRIPDSVLVIGEAAFENCSGLQRVNLGEGVEQIKDRAFFGCGSLEAVSVPASVQSVGLQAFGGSEAIYRGSAPTPTYEVSATRLSNGEYRGLQKGSTPRQVAVAGVEPSMAALEGVERSYTLTVTESKDTQELERAWQRVGESGMPDSTVIYELRFTDGSNIPITELGLRGLTVILPVPDSLVGQELGLVTTDRNGQLEALGVERVMLEGREAFRFRITNISTIGVYGRGTAQTGTELREVGTGRSAEPR
ncbi:MAG: leucine-rich repeat domain-containing protein [bacterium]|nr:leucine-rich repeat domain-containing protein [bacterium]